MATILRLKNVKGNSSVIGWGKYANRNVEWVLQNDPDYLRWVYFNLKAARMKGDLCAALQLDPCIAFKNRKKHYGITN